MQIIEFPAPVAVLFSSHLIELSVMSVFGLQGVTLSEIERLLFMYGSFVNGAIIR